jgi:hypothetical protein
MTSDFTSDSAKRNELLAKVLGNVLMQCMNESMVMVQLEAFSFFSPTPASLHLDDNTPLSDALNRLSSALGGPPQLIVVPDNAPHPYFDTYAEAAISEGIEAFLRARTSVCRTHLYLIGSALITSQPELMHLPEDPNIRRILITEVNERFWEHAETSYVRLASFWDRMGQILDFVFFNIRQYEHDGFAAVFDRIKCNFVPMSPQLRDSPAWIHLNEFQKSERKDGLKWLLRRRNLLIHSLHLSPTGHNDPVNPIFTCAFNHLEAAALKKLHPGTAEEELQWLHEHLGCAARLLQDIVDLSLLGVSIARPKTSVP